MEWITRSGIPLGVIPAVGAVAPELHVWCTSRSGGTSAPPYDSLNLGTGTGDRPGKVRENRRRLLHALGIPAKRVARGVQVHGSRIAIVHRGGVYRGTDGFITTTRRLALAINTADCYPVVVYAPSEKALASLHVGRGGAILGIIPAALEKMRTDHSIDAPHAIAIIGPGICKRCYTVYQETAGCFPARYVHRKNNAYHLDLPALVTDQLLQGGLKRRNIFRANLCTSCNPGLFYSHRRDGGDTGRHWMLAMIGPSP